MLSHPAEKYRPYPPIALPDRRWPDRQISHAPRWLSTDLRDGNQALAEPMDSAWLPSRRSVESQRGA